MPFAIGRSLNRFLSAKMKSWFAGLADRPFAMPIPQGIDGGGAGDFSRFQYAL